MKHKIFWIVYCAEAVLCIVLVAVQTSFSSVVSSMMAFPFEQIGMVLRALSLSSGVGNAAAIVLYWFASLLPIALLTVFQKKRKLFAEDGLLVLLSAVLFVVLYLMINPGNIGMITREASMLPVGKAMLGGVVYSLLCAYMVLRALRLFSHSGTELLTRYMAVMLCLLGVIFVYAVFGAGLSGLLDSFASLRTGNTGNAHLLGTSYVFLVLQFIVDALPLALDILILFSALRLLDQLPGYTGETVAAADRMSKLCLWVLAATVLSNAAFNLLQLRFAKTLMMINVSVNIPVLSIAFVLIALLLSRLITENKRLKDENDMII